MQIALRANITVDGTTDHIKGVLNYDNDLISRNGDNGKGDSPVDILLRYPVGLLVTRHSHEWLDRLLSICNPESASESSSDIETFWSELNNFVNFLTQHVNLEDSRSKAIVKSGPIQSLQLFISAPVTGRPSFAKNKRLGLHLTVNSFCK